MRYILFAMVFAVSFLTNAQHVLTNFERPVLEQDFRQENSYFPQRLNANEILIPEEGQYLVQRMNPSDQSVAYAKSDKEFGNFHLLANFELVKSKDNAGGVVIHGQTSSNSGIIIEINSKCRYRVRKILDGQERLLTDDGKNGWVKSKKINKKGNNQLEVKVENGYYDLYVNGHFIRSFFDIQFKSGLCGFIVEGGSALKANTFAIYEKGFSVVEPSNDGETASGQESDEDFAEVILIFKTKIDQQQAEINSIKSELDRCRSMLNYDTTIVDRAEKLDVENERLTFLLDSTSTKLKAAEKRLEYLESFMEDIEAGSNGDLIINLTSILADVKKKNAKLEADFDTLQAENKELKKGNDIMLREIDRLRKLVEAQNE